MEKNSNTAPLPGWKRIPVPKLSPAEKARVMKEVEEAKQHAREEADTYAYLYGLDEEEKAMVEEIIFWEHIPEGADGMDLSLR